MIQFSTNHANNTFDFLQIGSGNYIGWVSYWGSGKSWGGDVDGTNNTESVIQYDGATYGRHIWGDYNTVDVYQSGTHTHNLDIHVSNVDHEIHQEGVEHIIIKHISMVQLIIQIRVSCKLVLQIILQE